MEGLSQGSDTIRHFEEITLATRGRRVGEVSQKASNR